MVTIFIHSPPKKCIHSLSSKKCILSVKNFIPLFFFFFFKPQLSLDLEFSVFLFLHCFGFPFQGLSLFSLIFFACNLFLSPSLKNFKIFPYLLKKKLRGTWLAQSEHVIVDLRVMVLNPTMRVEITFKSYTIFRLKLFFYMGHLGTQSISV